MEGRGYSKTPRAQHPQKHPPDGIPRNSLPKIWAKTHPHPRGFIHRLIRRISTTHDTAPHNTAHSTTHSTTCRARIRALCTCVAPLASALCTWSCYAACAAACRIFAKTSTGLLAVGLLRLRRKADLCKDIEEDGARGLAARSTHPPWHVATARAVTECGHHSCVPFSGIQLRSGTFL